jgi:putative aldouronate transport system permease protein
LAKVISNAAYGKPARRKTLEVISRQRYLLLMLLPTLIIITIFVYKPVLYWVIAFKDYQVGKSVFEGDWIGFSQFREFLIDSGEAFPVFRNTLLINISSLFINLLGAMTFSILLNEIRMKQAKSLIQTLSLFPFFVSWVITYSFFQVFFSINTGLINTVLVKYGIIQEGINILGDPKYSLLLMIMANLWKSLGYNAVIFLATIAGIDQEQYESANIDGAGRLDKIRYITIPSMYGTLSVLLILNSGWILNSNFEQFYQFTNPTNLPTMEVFDMFVYRYGLKLARFSYATAVGIFKTVISLIMIIIANTAYRKLSDRSIF